MDNFHNIKIPTQFLIKILKNMRISAASHGCLVISDSTMPWTIAHQAPRSMGFPRQEYWSRLPFAFPRYLPQSGIKPSSPALQADSLLLTYQLSGSQSWYFIE